jgi:hypothetical protein
VLWSLIVSGTTDSQVDGLRNVEFDMRFEVLTVWRCRCLSSGLLTIIFIYKSPLL